MLVYTGLCSYKTNFVYYSRNNVLESTKIYYIGTIHEFSFSIYNLLLIIAYNIITYKVR